MHDDVGNPSMVKIVQSVREMSDGFTPNGHPANRTFLSTCLHQRLVKIPFAVWISPLLSA